MNAKGIAVIAVICIVAGALVLSSSVLFGSSVLPEMPINDTETRHIIESVNYFKTSQILNITLHNTLNAPFSYSDVIITNMNMSKEYILINSDLLMQETGLHKHVIAVGAVETMSLPFDIDYGDENIWKIQVGRYFVVQRFEVPVPPPPQTQVHIDSLTWEVTNNAVVALVRNTGSTPVTIESIALRTSSVGSTYYSEAFTTGNVINTGQTTAFEWDEAAASSPADFLTASTEYVIRVTTSTGFNYERTATSPPQK